MRLLKLDTPSAFVQGKGPPLALPVITAKKSGRFPEPSKKQLKEKKKERKKKHCNASTAI